MAAQAHSNIVAQTQTLDTLPKLVRRLRDHAKKINNRACRDMAQDLLAAAMVIERDLVYRNVHSDVLVGDLTADEAMAVAKMTTRFHYEDAARFASRHDGGAERDAMLNGIDKLQSALADAGYALT